MTRFVLTFLALTGCQSRITGNEGNFLFSYWADDDIVDFNKPIAVNAFLDVEVREVGTQLPVTLTDASTDDPAVLDVTGFDSYVATVQGMGDGGALLSVAGTTAGGDALTDSVNLLARVPEVHVLGHTCTPDTTAGYLVDSEILVPYEFMMTNGQNVIGYGYYPVSTQAGAMTLVEADSSQQFMAFTIGSAPASETLVSDLTGAAITMEIVDATSLDGVQEPLPFVGEDIDVGDVNAFYVRPMVGDAVVCQADTLKTVVSDTPDICDVRDKPDGVGDPSTAYEYGWFEIEGVAEGTCLYTVTFTEGGAGATAQFSYEIQP